MCRFIAAALLSCIVMSITLAADASEGARYNNAQDNSANRLNRGQLFRGGIGPARSSGLDSNEPARLDNNAAEIGILFFRRDGGDPKDLRVDDSTLLYITGRMGEDHTYQNGRQIEIHPALMESIRQIATTIPCAGWTTGASLRASSGSKTGVDLVSGGPGYTQGDVCSGHKPRGHGQSLGSKGHEDPDHGCVTQSGSPGRHG
jgi:hypothetical protein